MVSKAALKYYHPMGLVLHVKIESKVKVDVITLADGKVARS